jgi:hypothetical protein
LIGVPSSNGFDCVDKDWFNVRRVPSSSTKPLKEKVSKKDEVTLFTILFKIAFDYTENNSLYHAWWVGRVWRYVEVRIVLFLVGLGSDLAIFD